MIQFASIVFSHASFESRQAPLVKKKVQLLMCRLNSITWLACERVRWLAGAFSLNSPMAEYFPVVDVEVGNELFWYIFEGERKASQGYIDLDEGVAGLGLTVNEKALQNFQVME